ncbi:MAG TPA: D-2-hydroxyacid dehydrogenase [Candidatus Dormibacteraeota bacterium]
MTLVVPEWYRELVEPGLDGAAATFYRDEKGALEALPAADGFWLELWGQDPSVEGLVTAGKGLRWIQLSSAGVESMDFELLRRRGIMLTNGAGLHAPPIAEHVVMCMLMAGRGILPLLRAQAEGRWDRRAGGRAELAGSEVLILGYGLIGRAIAKKARALGAHVIGARRRGRAGRDVVVGDAWHELLPQTDFLVVAAPLTPATRGIVGRAELAALKPGSWLVNIARGPLVDEAALLDALDGGTLGGAALDVFDQEPLPKGHPLWSKPNVILTPHVSASTTRMQQRAAALFLDNAARFQAGRRLRNVVDLRAGY